MTSSSSARTSRPPTTKTNHHPSTIQPTKKPTTEVEPPKRCLLRRVRSHLNIRVQATREKQQEPPRITPTKEPSRECRIKTEISKRRRRRHPKVSQAVAKDVPRITPATEPSRECKIKTEIQKRRRRRHPKVSQLEDDDSEASEDEYTAIIQNPIWAHAPNNHQLSRNPTKLQIPPSIRDSRTRYPPLFDDNDNEDSSDSDSDSSSGDEDGIVHRISDVQARNPDYLSTLECIPNSESSSEPSSEFDSDSDSSSDFEPEPERNLIKPTPHVHQRTTDWLSSMVGFDESSESEFSNADCCDTEDEDEEKVDMSRSMTWSMLPSYDGREMIVNGFWKVPVGLVEEEIVRADGMVLRDLGGS